MVEFDYDQVHDDPLSAPVDGPTQWVSFVSLLIA